MPAAQQESELPAQETPAYNLIDFMSSSSSFSLWKRLEGPAEMWGSEVQRHQKRRDEASILLCF